MTYFTSQVLFKRWIEYNFEHWQKCCSKHFHEKWWLINMVEHLWRVKAAILRIYMYCHNLLNWMIWIRSSSTRYTKKISSKSRVSIPEAERIRSNDNMYSKIASTIWQEVYQTDVQLSLTTDAIHSVKQNLWLLISLMRTFN